jgi:Icc-related predicted phosphoesterase
MKLLIFSDIHSDLKALERLVKTEADYYFAAGDLVSWARGLDKAGEVLKARAGRTFVLPGNHESERDIENFCAKFGFTDFHGKHVIIGGRTIAGLGCSTPTPFNTPGEYSEERMAAELEKFVHLEPDVLICHAPPAKSSLDRAGANQHYGSEAVRRFIERMQPRYFFCGHIHEAEGVEERIGETLCVNVGKRGYLLEL